MFSNPITMDCFDRLDKIRLDADSRRQSTAWIKRYIDNESFASLKLLNEYHEKENNIILEIKATHQQLMESHERAKTNIQDQQQIINRYEQKLKENENAYQMAIIKNNENTILSIEQDNADLTKQIKFATVRLKANQTAAATLQRYIDVIKHMLFFLESKDRIRADSQAKLDFEPKLQVFIADLKEYIQHRRDICRGFVALREDETINDLIQQIRHSLEQ